MGQMPGSLNCLLEIFIVFSLRTDTARYLAQLVQCLSLLILDATEQSPPAATFLQESSRKDSQYSRVLAT
ncbi:hypothetical protein CVS30_00380 [Arthrobacter psychrolactophilus]|uniref:Uncharacterized protein n=1 Tax=Arthrobacter psychrolactophilus TaxID=92442 RepID=A0A2V5IVI1_9MICC|nr:hypothetical protein CVS30_00380 [Arthrobacter psychrolactophilus]